jgi:hypothetical protein
VSLDLNVARNVVERFYGSMPHPLAPEVKVSDYPAYARAATIMKGEFPNGDDVRTTYHALKQANVSPAEYEYLNNLMTPITTRFFGKGRRPQLQEIAKLKDAGPNEIYQYFASMSHPQYPEAKIGDMFRYYHAALPISREHTDPPREPVASELARFAVARYDAEAIHQHYHAGSEPPRVLKAER